MIIYKTTNKTNKKVYIGQTIRTLDQRWKQHINYSHDLSHNTHFARAIRKYGSGGFIVEQIDKASSQEELDSKEKYWIEYFDAIKNGYNESDGSFRCGGNTYRSKSKEELDLIGNKIRSTKIGKLNPAAKRVQLIDIIDNTTKEFDTIKECAQYLGINKGTTSIVNHLQGRVLKPFRKRYKFEYI